MQGAAAGILMALALVACSREPSPQVEAVPAAVLDAAPSADIQRVYMWTCEDGTTLRMDNLIERDAIVLYLPDGMLTLPHVISASGAKYEDETIVFWTKGNEALLERKPNPAINCQVSRAPE